jgi:hypothetical protein
LQKDQQQQKEKQQARHGKQAAVPAVSETPPPSFSQVQLDLPEHELRQRYPRFPGLAATSVVVLQAGDMLYLPAGWCHEVTSYGGPGESWCGSWLQLCCEHAMQQLQHDGYVAVGLTGWYACCWVLLLQWPCCGTMPAVPFACFPSVPAPHISCCRQAPRAATRQYDPGACVVQASKQAQACMLHCGCCRP